MQEGLVLCNAMHITASVFINDDEPGLHEDYKKWLEELAPFDASPQREQYDESSNRQYVLLPVPAVTASVNGIDHGSPFARRMVCTMLS